MPLPNPGMDFTAFDVLTASQLDDMVENIEALQDGSAFNVNTFGQSRLEAIETTDLFNNTALTASTWTDFKGNQNFTVASSDSVILISIVGQAQIASSSLASLTGSRIIIDSAGTPITRRVGGAVNLTATQPTNPFAGSGMIILTGLSAGTHTIKTQVYSQTANSVIYCRCLTLPDIECFATYVMEIKK